MDEEYNSLVSGSEECVTIEVKVAKCIVTCSNLY